MTIFTNGGVVQPGQILMEIVPEQASQVIVARIAPNDIDNLAVGQETEVQFPGLRERSLPSVMGKVAVIGSDSVVDEGSGISYFRAEIVVPPAELAKLGSSARTVRTGTPAQVLVKTRERTALAYLVEPFTRNLWKAGAEQ